LNIPYKTPWNASVDLRDRFYSEKHSKYLRVLPYNRFDIDDPKNWWWLSPTPDIPANRHGKFLFCGDDYGRICIGLAMEKGFGKGFTLDPERKPYAMDKSWEWQKFYPDLANGEFEKALQVIQERSGGAKPILSISWSFFTIGKPIEGEVSYEWDAKDGLTCIDSSEVVFKKCRNVVAIHEALAKYVGTEECWIDFLAMLPFEPVSKDGTEGWTPQEIKRNLMEPLEKWVK
jgi:hypothetical protein